MNGYQHKVKLFSTFPCRIVGCLKWIYRGCKAAKLGLFRMYSSCLFSNTSFLSLYVWMNVPLEYGNSTPGPFLWKTGERNYGVCLSSRGHKSTYTALSFVSTRPSPHIPWCFLKQGIPLSFLEKWNRHPHVNTKTHCQEQTNRWR